MGRYGVSTRTAVYPFFSYKAVRSRPDVCAPFFMQVEKDAYKPQNILRSMNSF